MQKQVLAPDDGDMRDVPMTDLTQRVWSLRSAAKVSLRQADWTGRNFHNVTVPDAFDMPVSLHYDVADPSEATLVPCVSEFAAISRLVCGPDRRRQGAPDPGIFAALAAGGRRLTMGYPRVNESSGNPPNREGPNIEFYPLAA